MPTNVYIDGFNLYYGAIKGTEFHWLDLRKMCNFLLPNHQVGTIRYFTAIASGRDDDPDKPVRQQLYLRALQTLPDLTVSLGQFKTRVVPMRLADPPLTGSRNVRVLKTEEKGSDVNLATHLLHDGHLNRYETAILISNDSDLIEPLKIVRRELGKKIGIINPRGVPPSKELLAESDFQKQLRTGVLKASQFPTVVTDSKGSFENPYPAYRLAKLKQQEGK